MFDAVRRIQTNSVGAGSLDARSAGIRAAGMAVADLFAYDSGAHAGGAGRSGATSAGRVERLPAWGDAASIVPRSGAHMMAARRELRSSDWRTLYVDDTEVAAEPTSWLQRPGVAAVVIALLIVVAIVLAVAMVAG